MSFCSQAGWGSLSAGHMTGGSLSRGLCLGGLCLGGSLSRGSLSRNSLSGGLCPGGISVRETPPYGNAWAVHILLECILVSPCNCQKWVHNPLLDFSVQAQLDLIANVTVPIKSITNYLVNSLCTVSMPTNSTTNYLVNSLCITSNNRRQNGF